MKTIHLNRDNLSSWQKKSQVNVIALGCFDGLHHGHHKVISTAHKKAKDRNVQLAVMSFFPHPKTVVSNGKKQVQYLMPLKAKAKRLESLGVDTFYIVEFNKEFAELSAEQFVVEYLIQFNAVHVVAGFDFCYGFQGSGNMDRLPYDSGGLIDVTKVEKVGYMGEKISSTAIRDRLQMGKVEELPHFLGTNYEVECDWDGRTLKPLPYYTLPIAGVYRVTIKNKTDLMKTEVIVLQNDETGQSLTSVEYIPPSMKGKLTIIWESRIGEKNPQREKQIILI